LACLYRIIAIFRDQNLGNLPKRLPRMERLRTWALARSLPHGEASDNSVGKYAA